MNNFRKRRSRSRSRSPGSRKRRSRSRDRKKGKKRSKSRERKRSRSRERHRSRSRSKDRSGRYRARKSPMWVTACPVFSVLLRRRVAFLKKKKHCFSISAENVPEVGALPKRKKVPSGDSRDIVDEMLVVLGSFCMNKISLPVFSCPLTVAAVLCSLSGNQLTI